MFAKELQTHLASITQMTRQTNKQTNVKQHDEGMVWLNFRFLDGRKPFPTETNGVFNYDEDDDD